jgi:hypothetical protein
MKVNSNYKIFLSKLDGHSSEEEELNVDDMLNTSNYIYLEEHHKLDSYAATHNHHRLKKYQSSADLGSGGAINNFSSANTNFDSDTLSAGGSALRCFEEQKEIDIKFGEYFFDDDQKENNCAMMNAQSACAMGSENVKSTAPTNNNFKFNQIQSIPIQSKSKFAQLAQQK